MTLTTAPRTAESNTVTVELERPETGSWHFRPGLTLNRPLLDWRADMDSIRECSVNECGATHYARGFCRKHWERNHLHGSPGPTNVLQGASVAERLAHHSAHNGDCIEWTGRRDKNGYGDIQIAGRSVRAHRASYEIVHGAIPNGLVLRHKCDNPPCINPDHLETGTHADNQRDKRERGRSTRGEANPSARLTAARAQEIRARAASGEVQRRLAAEFGISPTQVCRIVHGESWSA